MGAQPLRAVPAGDDGPPAAPADLGADGRRFWAAMAGAYEMSPGELALLGRACKVADRMGVIDEVLDEMHLTDPATMPLLKHITDLERSFATLIAAMAIPLPGELEGQPRNLRQVMAAKARWQHEKARGQAPPAG
jgi:hypothetical protein